MYKSSVTRGEPTPVHGPGATFLAPRSDSREEDVIVTQPGRIASGGALVLRCDRQARDPPSVTSKTGVRPPGRKWALQEPRRGHRTVGPGTWVRAIRPSSAPFSPVRKADGGGRSYGAVRPGRRRQDSTNHRRVLSRRAWPRRSATSTTSQPARPAGLMASKRAGLRPVMASSLTGWPSVRWASNGRLGGSLRWTARRSQSATRSQTNGATSR